MADFHKKETILVVDDIPENIFVLTEILKDRYAIKAANGGEKALKIAMSDNPPDLILLDIMMPVMDGLEVCRRLKEHDATRAIPVIFVTALGEVENEKIGFDAGAVDYITKPVSPSIVNSRVRTHLSLYNQNRVLEEKVAERTRELSDTLSRLTETQEQLVQSAKLASIGELATGVAHEINQPLNVIRMAAKMLKKNLEKQQRADEFACERLDKIEKSIVRATRIIDHLKIFGRKDEENLVLMNINDTIKSAFDFVSEQFRLHSIGVEMDLDDALPGIMGDSNRLEQVFINLIVNARDAFSDRNREGCPSTISVASAYDRDRGHVVVRFADNGPGIPKDIMPRIFDPFFTTKEVGKGTGLGLSISYGIVKTHGGTIDVQADAGGTRFTLEFPPAAATK
jgi:two-component system, NtrC family, sensor kinase